MFYIGVDLGGTKVALAIFDAAGNIIHKKHIPIEQKERHDVGSLLIRTIGSLLSFAKKDKKAIASIGIAIPGIYYSKTGRVWAPNIENWENYPLLQHINSALNTESLIITVESDRSCYILGETWRGHARDCTDAIFIAVGTGIGAGILIDGNILQGNKNIAGAIGWMTLNQPYQQEYKACGQFEYYASGDGIARLARKLISENTSYQGILKKMPLADLTSHHVFAAYNKQDFIAAKVLDRVIGLWGRAAANLVSIFNPQKIIFGGGVFGPAKQFIKRIAAEAALWSQPISYGQVKIEYSLLGADAGLFGAGRLAMLAAK